MNLAEIRTAVDRKTGHAVDAAALTQFVNEAVNAVAEERPWPWLDATDEFDTSAGQSQYALLDDYAWTRAVTVNGVEARQIGLVDLDAGTSMFEYAYTIEGGDLIVWPTPTSGVPVVHRYRRTEPELVNDTDTPLIPAQYHQAVVAYTAALVCDRASDKRGAMFRSEYDRWLGRMIDSLQRSSQPTRIRVRPGAGW